MYSNSNSYLGGSNSGRPGFSQYGQSSYGSQTPNSISSQPTGYNAGGPQQQYPGYPSQQQPQPLSAQYTAAPVQNGQQYQQQFIPPPAPQPPQYPQPLSQQPLQTGYGQANPIPPKQQPQPTGMTSTQMADSFRSSSATTTQPIAQGKSSKIPNMRLSFITAQDQAKFEQLFKSAVGNNQAMSGDQARDLLLRSGLSGDVLSDIWMLSDTTKAGQLLFPEFALAMYLCNLKLNGRALPAALPDKVKNEVSSMVDIISFGIPDDRTPTPQRTNVPNFDEQPKQSSFAGAPVQQPQPQQPSNSQLLSALVATPTGYSGQSQGSVYSQPTGLTQQNTSFMQNPQAIGYNGPRPPMPPMPSGLQQNNLMAAPLNAQPTGRPGQWGLVNAPASGLPNIDALRSQMMPQQGREGGFTSHGLSGNATVPWAVTKDEKRIYDDLFRAWDGFNKGFITGSQAIEIFGQSGLAKPDLEAIWTLSDPNNRGRLDLDEFAVAMHLIYRKLNGYPVPNRLPPELVPPSTRNFASSLGTVKSLLSRDAEERKSSGTFLQPQQTGVSYLKNHSFSAANGSATATRKDGTVFKNNDDDVGYKSSARRRLGADGRSPSPAQASSPVSENGDELSLEQLQKKIREKQVLLDAIDFQDEGLAEQDEALDRKDRRDAEDLFRRIRRIQEDIDSNPASAFRSSDSEAERRTLRRQLQTLTDRLPDLASHVRRTERAIAEAQLELFRLKDAKAHPNASAPISGTGPGGAVTESDRLKARAKALMQQRSAALAGRPVPSTTDDSAAATARFEEENSRVKGEREGNERMVKDVEEGVSEYSRGVKDSLLEGGRDESSEHERRRWEEGLGVEDEVKDFIFDLQRSSRSARVRKEETTRDTRTANLRSPPVEEKPSSSFTQSTAPVTESAAPTQASAGSYSSYRTGEERAAFIKQQAEQRMAERLAALGLRAPTKGGETAQQKQERERKEREDRVRQAEAEDARREQERQRRLEEEQIAPPSIAKSSSKAPPAPPSRSRRADSYKSESKRASQDFAGAAIIEQQAALEKQTQALEDEERRQEEELRKEREASEARRLQLEEQVRQGKIKKEEEKKRKQAASKETKEKEARLAAQRAELEAAREREKELQRQLEAIDDDDDSSSDDEGPQQITPEDNTPLASQVLSRDSPAAPVVPPTPQISVQATQEVEKEVQQQPTSSAVTSPSATDPTTNNPFFKRMQSTDQITSTSVISPPAAVDKNPFHKFSQQTDSKTALPATTEPPARLSRPREEDDWSVVESDADSDDDSNVGGGNAKELVSRLFGSMAPPRPLSAMDSPKAETPTSIPAAPAFAAPPLPPPLPQGAPAAPPPPPPPPPPAGGPPAAPALPKPSRPNADFGSLFGEIQAGKGLKKVQTKDRSASSVAGRVLG